jgi:hypothetical protein
MSEVSSFLLCRFRSLGVVKLPIGRLRGITRLGEFVMSHRNSSPQCTTACLPTTWSRCYKYSQTRASRLRDYSCRRPNILPLVQTSMAYPALRSTAHPLCSPRIGEALTGSATPHLVQRLQVFNQQDAHSQSPLVHGPILAIHRRKHSCWQYAI